MRTWVFSTFNHDNDTDTDSRLSRQLSKRPDNTWSSRLKACHFLHQTNLSTYTPTLPPDSCSTAQHKVFGCIKVYLTRYFKIMVKWMTTNQPLTVMPNTMAALHAIANASTWNNFLSTFRIELLQLITQELPPGELWNICYKRSFVVEVRNHVQTHSNRRRSLACCPHSSISKIWRLMLNRQTKNRMRLYSCSHALRVFDVPHK